ncbi:pyrimidodiazepine synthase-like [Drosophila ficusphila]|uniref:pyrimidodiazepine synthase-like n=1 Tax=Drosophila ficusphila TaxID=30025 RepID=UPI0007E63760|nr:pyrimidodiazepine synthase-like [Drosophila ficusphila]
MSSGKHLAKGSPKPVLPEDGLLRLYSMRFCPFAQRAHLALNAKKVPHHAVYINLTEKPEWFGEVSPLLKVPALQLAGEKNQPSLIESLIISEYLDEKYPENPLLPKDALKRAQDKILLERFSGLSNAFTKIRLEGTGLDDFWVALDIFEKELSKRGTAFFGGDKPGFVDYMIWPWFERLSVIKLRLGDEYKFDEKRFAKISQWISLLKEDPVVQSFYATPEQHDEFWRTRQAGNANYDLLA